MKFVCPNVKYDRSISYGYGTESWITKGKKDKLWKFTFKMKQTIIEDGNV